MVRRSMHSSSRTPSRRWLRLIGYGFASLLLLVLLLAALVYTVSEIRLRRGHDLKVAALAVPEGDESIARGRHLAATRGCADCHGADYGGQLVVQDPLIGQLAGPNITRGRGGLPANVDDADLVRAIRHGVAADGRALVMMPSEEYSQLSDEDLGALIAFLKAQPAVDRERVPIKVGPLARALIVAGQIRLAAEHIDHVTPRPTRVEANVSAAYGQYLAATCTGCHGSNLSGGRIPGGAPDWPQAANLTPHETGRLAAWTEQDFFGALRQQERPDGSKLHPAMPAGFGQLTDDELKALWLFLRSLPAVATGTR